MEKIVYFNYKGENYKVVIEFKNVKNINLRYTKDYIHVSCPTYYELDEINKLIESSAPRLIESRNDKTNRLFSKEGVYILGNLYPYEDGHFIKVDNHYLLIESEADFYKKIKPYATKVFSYRLQELEKLMTPYKKHILKVRKAISTYGINYYTKKTIILNTYLIHFRVDIIDSVIIHELAHDYVHNHSSEFYRIVYKYCPNYGILQGELKYGY